MPITSLEDFLTALDRMERPLVVVAHQDDEITFGGTLTRCGDRARIVWVTNGDGLYFQTDLAPKEYGQIRMAEALHSAAAAGVDAARTECLDFSEVEIYRRMMYVTKDPAAVLRLKPFFQKIADAIKDRIFAHRPEVVFTGGYQGGNPEHDLTHFFTRLALDEYERETGLEVPLIHVPMYEYTILIAMRFNPAYPGLRWRYVINEREKQAKREMIEAYPSQTQLFAEFERVVGAVSFLGYLKNGRRLSLEEYASIEEYGPVPKGWDYLKNPHTFDWANYIGDDFAGVPVSFDKSVRPIVASFPRPL
ncbi:MAG: PIG-L family deacetylase [Candidatus Lernaella stagnicola]|nr:PIG-L family deacetylase [Candidatus Lernaella stagnicola]